MVWRLLLSAGLICLVVVVLSCTLPNDLDLLPAMGWGVPNSPGSPYLSTFSRARRGLEFARSLSGCLVAGAITRFRQRFQKGPAGISKGTGLVNPRLPALYWGRNRPFPFGVWVDCVQNLRSGGLYPGPLFWGGAMKVKTFTGTQIRSR